MSSHENKSEDSVRRSGNKKTAPRLIHTHSYTHIPLHTYTLLYTYTITHTHTYSQTHTPKYDTVQYNTRGTVQQPGVVAQTGNSNIGC